MSFRKPNTESVRKILVDAQAVAIGAPMPPVYFGTVDGHVHVALQRSTSWLALDKKAALQLANALLSFAVKLP